MRRTASRVEYGVSLVVVFLLGLVFPYLVVNKDMGGAIGLGAGGLAVVLAAVIWVVEAVRRLRDMGFSGTRMFWVFVPIANLAFFFVLMFWPSSKGRGGASVPPTHQKPPVK